jgi:ATP-binding cassette subfamily F protein 3
LDIPAQEVLQDALEHYQGTILLVSHDRYLVDRLATQIWELRGGRLHVFEGNYRQFLDYRAAGKPTRQSGVRYGNRPGKSAGLTVRVSRDASWQRDQALATLEADIAKREAALQRLGEDIQVAGDEGAFEEMHRLSWKYAQVQSDLENLMANWEELAV